MKASIRRLVPRGRAAAVCLSPLLALALAASPAFAVTITVKSTDGFGEGFNDLTSVAPVGGNPKTSLGQQRFHVFQYAANVWGKRLGGNLPIVVAASFDNLGGTSVSATLGYAAPNTVHRDFLHAPKTGTWYVAALANQLYGTDQNDLVPLTGCPTNGRVDGKCAEIVASFNSAVDNQTVLGAVDFYYGLDGNNGGDIDFLTVVLHEIGHGLGVLSLIDASTGAMFFNYSDAYTNYMQDPTISPKHLSPMTDVQRKQAIVDDGKLVTAGARTIDSSGPLSGGVRGDGPIQLFAPSSFIAGSSISHFDTDVSPNELMEPYFTSPPPRDFRITLALLEDLGWEQVEVPRCGDANGDKSISATDALIVLKTAVGSSECDGIVCDVNFAGGVTAGDALIVLKRSVGQSVTLKCPLA